MNPSRRKFLNTVLRRTASASILAGWAAGIGVRAAESDDQKSFFKLFSIGKVEKRDQTVRLRIYDEYVDGLLGLSNWSHVNVLYWFDKNDTPQQRRILQVHPRGDKQNPINGVFACRAPVRPNLIGLSVSKILSVQGNLVTLDDLDAFDGTPILDLKPFIPLDAPMKDVKVPAWAGPKKPAGS